MQELPEHGAQNARSAIRNPMAPVDAALPALSCITQKLAVLITELHNEGFWARRQALLIELFLEPLDVCFDLSDFTLDQGYPERCQISLGLVTSFRRFPRSR